MRTVLLFTLLGAATMTQAMAQSPAPPPVSIKTAAEIAAGLDKAGSAATTMTGTDVPVAPGIAVRRRASGGAPQYAIIHNLSIEVYEIIDGSGTLTTGGTLDPPPPADADPDLVRSARLLNATSRHLAKGDVVVLQPGTPHWFSRIDGTITYLETRVRVVK
jgi:mannose-6-phosphate isomerase-like protein (cupin superfamily)